MTIPLLVTLTQARLKELLHYNPDTGVFTRITGVSGHSVGLRVGSNHGMGYRSVGVDRIRYYEHRLAWLYMHGEFPEHQIDHINHDTSDNRIENLRRVTNIENQRNRSMSKNNTSGIMGVSFCKQTSKWVAEIKVNYRKINLGRFNTIQEATRAREAANDKYGFHISHGNPCCEARGNAGITNVILEI